MVKVHSETMKTSEEEKISWRLHYKRSKFKNNFCGTQNMCLCHSFRDQSLAVRDTSRKGKDGDMSSLRDAWFVNGILLNIDVCGLNSEKHIEELKVIDPMIL